MYETITLTKKNFFIAFTIMTNRRKLFVFSPIFYTGNTTPRVAIFDPCNRIHCY